MKPTDLFKWFYTKFIELASEAEVP